MSEHDVKQAEELLAMGGKFYTLSDGSWCDTSVDSWRLVAGVGYVRADASGSIAASLAKIQTSVEARSDASKSGRQCGLH